MRLKRKSSADSMGLQRQLSDDSDSSGRQLDLAELRRSRLQNPGKISMFGTSSERRSRKDEEDAQSNAEKARELFDLPETEKIITGYYIMDRSDCRVSCMVNEECHDSGVHGIDSTSYLLLRATTKDRCISFILRD